jgi:hypothetical protein
MFPSGIPAVGREIQFHGVGEKIGKGRITGTKAHAAYGQGPRALADCRKLLGSPLNEREK